MLLQRLLRYLPGGLFAEGLRAYNDGDYLAARTLFRDAVKQAAGHGGERIEFYLCETCIQVGDQEADAGRTDEAAAAYSEALELHPEYADVHNKLGETLLRAGRRAEAIVSFQQALGVNPRFYGARLNLVRVLLAEGNPAPAIEALLALQKQCPPLLREKAAALYKQCQEGDLASASAALEELQSSQPDELELKKGQALEAIQRGDNGLAIAILANLIARRGDYADMHHLLGLAYGNAEMLDDAILEFRRALDLNPYLTKARINLGVSLLETARYGEAAEELRRADAEEPYNPLIMNALKELEALTEA